MVYIYIPSPPLISRPKRYGELRYKRPPPKTNLLRARFNLISLARSVYTVQSVASIHPRTWTQTQQMAAIVRKSSCGKAEKLNEMERQSLKFLTTKGKNNCM